MLSGFAVLRPLSPRFLRHHFLRKALPLSLVLLVSGCASMMEDPRNNARPDLWWLGAESPNTMRWPARDVPELAPMPVESIPERGASPSIPSPGWPPL